jgi:hypothetical protein
MMDPYFRENESSETSGILTGTRVFLNIHTFTSRAHGARYGAMLHAPPPGAGNDVF